MKLTQINNLLNINLKPNSSRIKKYFFLFQILKTYFILRFLVFFNEYVKKKKILFIRKQPVHIEHKGRKPAATYTKARKIQRNDAK